jgi:hypothetical protein
MSKSTRFSHDLVCRIVISMLFWSSWGVKELGITVLTLSICIWATLASLSSQIMVDELMLFIPQDFLDVVNHPS